MPQSPVVPEGDQRARARGARPYPDLRRFGTESAADRSVVARTLPSAGPQASSRTALPWTLSGGELQRVVLASRARPGTARCCSSTSPPAPWTSATSRRSRPGRCDAASQDGLTVVAAMHDLTLAGHYGRRVVLLHQGRVVADGLPRGRARAARLAEVYGARVEVLQREAGPAVLPVRERRPECRSARRASTRCSLAPPGGAHPVGGLGAIWTARGRRVPSAPPASGRWRPAPSRCLTGAAGGVPAGHRPGTPRRPCWRAVGRAASLPGGGPCCSARRCSPR